LLYDARAIDDLHAMLKERGDWVELGSADEQKEAKEGSVEAWGRSPDNPIGGWYGLKKGLRGRFGMYLRRCSKLSETQSSSTTPAPPASARSDGHEVPRSRRAGPPSPARLLARGDADLVAEGIGEDAEADSGDLLRRLNDRAAELLRLGQGGGHVR